MTNILLDLQSGNIVLTDRSFDIVDTLGLLRESVEVPAFARGCLRYAGYQRPDKSLNLCRGASERAFPGEVIHFDWFEAKVLIN